MLLSGFYGDSTDEDGFPVGWPDIGNNYNDEAYDFLPPLRARGSWTLLPPAHSSGSECFPPSSSAQRASEFHVDAHCHLSRDLAGFEIGLDDSQADVLVMCIAILMFPVATTTLQLLIEKLDI